MNRMARTVVAAWMVLAVGAPAWPQNQLGKVLKKKYHVRSVTCSACHVKGQDKHVLTPFGQTVAKLVAEKDIIARIGEAKKMEDDAEKARVLSQIEDDLLAALKKLDTMRTADGRTYAQLIRSGDIRGIKPHEPE